MADVPKLPVPSRNEPSEPRASILLVDDNPANLLSLRAILEVLGHDLVEARSGEEALNRAQSEEFAVVLLDVLMPGMSGFETAKLIRHQDRSRHTPVIFLTASDIDRPQLEEGYALGAVDFLVKPLVPVVLQSKVRGFIELFQDKQRARHEADQLRLLVHGTTEYAIFMLDPQGHVVTWNSGAERLKGYRAEEFIGQHFSRFYPHEAIERGWPAHELKVAAAEGRFEDEGWRLRKDGTQFWANVVITALWDEQRQLRGFSKVTRDLTARKQTEDALRRSEERFRLLVEGATDYAIFLLDPQGHVASWNAGAERIKQYKAEEIVGQHFSRFYPQDALDRGWPAHELTVAKAEGRFEDEGWRVRKDGSQFWANVVITALKDEQGRMLGFSKITRDLTERKKSEENARRLAEMSAARRIAEENARLIRDERERLHVTLASIGDAVISTDAEGRVDFLNPVAEELVGWKTEEAATRSLEDVFRIINETTRQPVDNPALRALREGVIVGLANHTVLIAKDGQERPIDDSAAPIRDAGGNVVGSVLVFRDISERKRSEAALNERVRLLTLNSEVGAALVQADQLRPMLQRCTEALVDHLHGTFARIWTLNLQGDVLELQASAGLYTHLDGPHSRVPVGKFKIGLIAQERKPHLTNSVVGDPRVNNQEWAQREGIVAFAGYPLVVDDRLVGVMAMFARQPLSETTLDAMASVADEIAVGVERKTAQERLHEQQEWLRVTLASIGDAVIATDTHGRVTFLNPVAEELTGWTQGGAQGRLLEDVFVILNEQTRQPVENPVEKVLRDGVVVGLGNHTVLIARDGTQRPIDDSAAPIRDTSGEMIGVVLIFRDVAEQRKAEEELRQSEGELADFFENATVGLHWVGREGTILRANRAELELLGYSRDEYVGRPIADFHADEDVICDILCRLQAGEHLHEYPARLRCKDGSIKDVLIDSNVMWRGGEFVHTRCFTRDVTERKRAEKLLACQKLALEMVADGTPLEEILDFLVRTIEAESTKGVIAAIHLLDQTGKYFRQAVAPSLPEAYHWATAIAVHPDTGPCCRAVSTRKSVTVLDVVDDPQWAAFAEMAIPLGIRSGWSTPILSSDGKVLGTFANYYRQPGDPSPQDRQLVEIVTRTAAVAIERVQARDALRESERVARFLADASAALAVLVDFDSTLQKVASLAVPSFADWASVDLLEGDGTLRRVAVAHVNPAKVELAPELHRRFPPDPAEPHGVWNILRTGQAEIVPKINEELLMQSIKDDELLRILRELGLKSYVGVPLKVRGRTLGVVTFIAAESGRRFDYADLATAQDLADRAAVAIDNAQLYRELRDADLRKDEFLATLAHELRNPLAPIRNGLQVLRLSGTENGTVAEARTMMERQLSQMVRLVDDLLDVSRITRNKLDLRRQRVALAAVVQSAVETSRPLIEQLRHTLSLTLPPDPVHIDADPVRLAQVFSNLLNNSAKYTEPGGRIWLAAEVSGHEVAVRVRDTGLGIPAEALPRIFEMFSQVDRNMERAQGGLGIGLTLVRRLVELHGGKVEARSDGPSRGSEFTVRLPLMKEGVIGSHVPTTADGRPTTLKQRILIVDDNHDSALSLGMMLDLMGNDTRTAHDGLAAVEAAAEFRPDLILLDIGLPKLNGYEACRRIREQPWSKGMVIVALTGWGQEQDRRRSAEAGFDHHMVKPVEVAGLEKLLATPNVRPEGGTAEQG